MGLRKLKSWHKLLVIPGALCAAAPMTSPACDTQVAGDLVAIGTAQLDLIRLRDCAQRGDVSAQMELARRYRTGQGVAPNEIESASWYQKAARRGIPEAEFQLGLMYLQGIGVTEDSYKAMRWISRAAKKNHEEAKVLYDYILHHDEPFAC